MHYIFYMSPLLTPFFLKPIQTYQLKQFQKGCQIVVDNEKLENEVYYSIIDCPNIGRTYMVKPHC